MNNLARSCIVVIVLAASSAVSQTANEWNTRGAEAYEAGRWSEATEAFQNAYNLDLKNNTIRRNLLNSVVMYAQHLGKLGDHATAIDWLEFIINVEPEEVSPLNQLGAYLMIVGDVSSAIFRLEESIELVPDDVNAHFLLGEAYYKDNDVTAAINQWEWVYKVDPDYGGLQSRLENALREEQVEFDFDGETSRNFNVTFNREAESDLVKDVLRILESAYKDIGKSLGGVFPPTPIQVSLYTSEGFLESTQLGQHVGAVFDGTKIRCPVIDKNGRPIPLNVLRDRLYHEYVHVVVHHSTKSNVPWWFNEGLAETLSTDIRADEKRLLVDAVKNRTLYEFETITPRDLLHTFEPDDLSLAYAQSHVAVIYLQRRFGTKRMARMLETLRGGLKGEDALLDAFGVSYYNLKSQVRSAANNL